MYIDGMMMSDFSPEVSVILLEISPLKELGLCFWTLAATAFSLELKSRMDLDRIQETNPEILRLEPALHHTQHCQHSSAG